MLREAHRVLGPGGVLLLESNNLAELLPRWQPAVAIERYGDLMIDRSTFDPATGRPTTTRTVVRDGRARRFNFSVRMFMAPELLQWLLDAGFQTVEFCDHDAEPLSVRSSRMVTVARR